MTTRVILATQESLCYDRTRLSRHSSESFAMTTRGFLATRVRLVCEKAIPTTSFGLF